MYKRFCLLVLLFYQATTFAQPGTQNVYSRFVLYNERQKLDKFLREQTITNTFSLPLDSNNEYRYEGSSKAISQFLIANEEVLSGFNKMFRKYRELQLDTKRAFLEAVYAVYPSEFKNEFYTIIVNEHDPKLFAMAAAYLLRADHSVASANSLLIRMTENFPQWDSTDLLLELQKYLQVNSKSSEFRTPDLNSLIQYQKHLGKKIIYSFQRWNRDFPGMAIVQNADGSFVKRSDGKIQVFQQLARSGSNLPYFLTDGSTPQGVYSILGTATVNNNLIGPTPTIQMLLPFESAWEKYFQLPTNVSWDTTASTLQQYLRFFPAAWQQYAPITEAYFAGKMGRTEIIAHGTTIDPEYFKTRAFYPLTPTMGCLCAREEWNVTTGRPTFSEQQGLINAYQSSAGQKGLLYVINLDHQEKPITREEIESIIKAYESRYGR